MRLSEQDKNTLVNALHLAAAQYSADVQTMRKEPGHDRLAEQFERQAADAKRLADAIENDEFARETLREHREAGLGSAMP